MTVLGIFDMTKAFKISEKQRMIITVFSLVSLVVFYSNGNLTEEYCLPFLSWSLSKEISYLRSKEKKHLSQYAFLYGVTFSVCLLTRITNAAPVCVMVALIAVRLMVTGEWKNLGWNILMFLMGFFIITIPFVIYFAMKHGLYEAIYGTLLYNFAYASSGKSSFFATLNVKSGLIAIFNYSILFGMLFIGIFILFKNKVLGVAYILVAVSCLFVCLSG